MRVAITGQLSLRKLGDWVDDPDRLPYGLGGTPPIPEIAGLLERGHEVCIVTLDPALREEVVLRTDALTVHVGPYRLRRAARDGFRSERRFVTDALRQHATDVVHAHWTYEFALAALASRLPTVVTAHDAPLGVLRYHLPTPRVGPRLLTQLPGTIHWSVRAAMAGLVARRASRLIAVSPHVEQHFRRALRFRGEIVVVPNLLDRIEVRDRVRMGNAPDDTRFLTVLGGWSPLKNAITAVRAFGQVRAALPRASLVMVGPGFEEGGPAEQWARERCLGAGIIFAGPLPHEAVVDEMLRADVLVHPALEEACCMVIAEAQSVGLPVIAGEHSGGVPWQLDHGRAGRLADVRKPSTVADAMRELACDAAIREHFARAGSALVRQRHQPDHLISEIESVLTAAALADRPKR